MHKKRTAHKDSPFDYIPILILAVDDEFTIAVAAVAAERPVIETWRKISGFDDVIVGTGIDRNHCFTNQFSFGRSDCQHCVVAG